MNEQLRQIQKYFDQKAPEWDYSFDVEKLERLRAIFKSLIPPLKSPVLDLGCGTGALLHVLPAQLSSNAPIIELDISFFMLTQALAKSRNLKIRVNALQGDGHALPFKAATVGSVVTFQVFPHFVQPQRVIEQIARCLKPGGLFCVLHLMDHQKLNNLHRRFGDVVENHALPAVQVLQQWVESQSFEVLRAIENQELYLLLAQKKKTTL